MDCTNILRMTKRTRRLNQSGAEPRTPNSSLGWEKSLTCQSRSNVQTPKFQEDVRGVLFYVFPRWMEL